MEYDRQLDYFNRRRIIYRRNPVNDKPTEVHSWGNYYEAGTYECYSLNGIELSIYDFIMGCNMLFATNNARVNDDMIKDFDRALTWFRKNNIEAYMVLLD